MTLDRRRRIRALAVNVSLLLAGLATPVGSEVAGAGDYEAIAGSTELTLGYSGIGPAADASRLAEAFSYPSGNQLPV
jgi:hypothetical protein